MFNSPYNLYSPYGYQATQGNNLQCAPQYQQSFIQPSYQQAQNNTCPWVSVDNMNDVENITVDTGQKAWIMLKNEPIFVVKEHHATGATTIDAYKFEKIEQKTPEYVTKAEFDELVKRLGGYEKEGNK